MVDVTEAIRWIPPIITRPRRIANTPPTSIGSKPNVASIEVAMPLDCGKFPVPNELMTVAIANATASHFIFKRLSI